MKRAKRSETNSFCFYSIILHNSKENGRPQKTAPLQCLIDADEIVDYCEVRHE
ncbi:hypothetical protein SIN01_16490 [Sporolactobacillus inulinus]|nr:hypothetical protein SIN01_16490 [Sporolactobacillus inulinus]